MKRVVPGIHSVHEALRVRPQQVREVWLREGSIKGELDLVKQAAERAKVKLKIVLQGVLDKRVESHQGVIAFVEGAPEYPSGATLKSATSGLIFVLDGIVDPHNLGSIMRTAWGLGALGVISSKDRSAGPAPSAQKVAAGGFEHVPFMETANLHAELISLKELGFWIYGLDQEANESLFSVSFSPKSVLVVGSEELGLRKPVRSACDILVKIPLADGVESFNASVAAAIGGYEVRKQSALPKRPENSTKKL